MAQQRQSINFDDGFKSYEINGDPQRIVRIDTADYGLIERLRNAKNNINEEMKKYTLSSASCSRCSSESLHTGKTTALLRRHRPQTSISTSKARRLKTRAQTRRRSDDNSYHFQSA